MDNDPRRIRLAAWQFGTSMMLVLGAVAMAASARGETATVGRTWPIAEPDALFEIEARVAQQPQSIAAKFGPREKWSAMQSATLGVAKTDRKRTVVPFHTLDFDIRLPDGKLLYPKGYTFNPLSYVSLPQRLVVVHSGDLGWALARARPSDWILLAGGTKTSSDPVTMGEKVGRPLFILEERVKQRLGLTVAPVIVAQVGQKLELSEFVVEPRHSIVSIK
jgi:conjugal transfer pilus assembly protein TraW